MKKSGCNFAHGPDRRRRGARGGLATLAAGCLLATLTGCGNVIEVHDAGQLGLTVDGVGHPVVAVMLCAKGHPLVGMYEGRKQTDPASKENVERGHWQSRRGFSGVGKLAITDPDTTWRTTQRLAPLESDRLFLVDGGTTEDDNASLGGINFHTSDLATLTPGQVRVNGKITSWSAFAAYRCH